MRLTGGLLICMLLVACGRASGQQSTAVLEVTAQSKPAKAPPPSITDFPEATQDLKVSGTVAASVTTGRPSSCGAGSGPYGPVIFAYGLYFQVGPVWYNLNVSTDNPSYAGAGTYEGRAILTPVTATSRVPAGPEYDGRAQLVVTTDQHPDRGAIDASVTRPNGDHVTISGSWTCTPSPLLGPG
ncbi:MAG: hypothetical protein M3Z11_10620 [Candidatus Dormibacteraeota bacterium]|nr:hypothetical protein [Candidatus Dormibacteraeota bacterium]